MHTPFVNSKNVSDHKDKKSFTAAAVTGISGKSLMVFAAVSQLHSPNPTWFLKGCRDKVGGGWENECICGLYFLKKEVDGNFSFRL